MGLIYPVNKEAINYSHAWMHLGTRGKMFYEGLSIKGKLGLNMMRLRNIVC